MATNEIKLGINLRQNKNARNSGYGKYYPEIDTQTTLSLRGFAKHMSDHGSIYSLDIIEGVLKKITQCLPELISQGVPVRMEPLGTFLPTCDVEKPILNIAAMENAAGSRSMTTMIKDSILRFIQNSFFTSFMYAVRGPVPVFFHSIFCIVLSFPP